MCFIIVRSTFVLISRRLYICNCSFVSIWVDKSSLELMTVLLLFRSSCLLVDEVLPQKRVETIYWNSEEEPSQNSRGYGESNQGHLVEECLNLLTAGHVEQSPAEHLSARTLEKSYKHAGSIKSEYLDESSSFTDSADHLERFEWNFASKSGSQFSLRAPQSNESGLGLSRTVRRLYTCNVCQKLFRNKVSFLRHGRLHTGEGLFKCRVCNKNVTTKYLLKEHERSHTKERPFSCFLCGAAFSQSSTLSNHIKRHRQKLR